MNQHTLRFILIAASLMASSLVSGSAKADNAILGGLLGGGTGAYVGQSFDGRNGAIIGGAVGAAAGVAIASEYRAAPRYYAPPQPTYYYAQPTVVYTPQPVYYQRYESDWGQHHKQKHGHGYGHDRDWDDGRHHR